MILADPNGSFWLFFILFQTVFTTLDHNLLLLIFQSKRDAPTGNLPLERGSCNVFETILFFFFKAYSKFIKKQLNKKQ